MHVKYGFYDSILFALTFPSHCATKRSRECITAIFPMGKSGTIDCSNFKKTIFLSTPFISAPTVSHTASVIIVVACRLNSSRSRSYARSNDRSPQHGKTAPERVFQSAAAEPHHSGRGNEQNAKVCPSLLFFRHLIHNHFQENERKESRRHCSGQPECVVVDDERNISSAA